MNTYQITAVRRRDGGGELQKCNAWIDAESLEGARERFHATHPGDGWTITGEELIDVGTPEDAPPKTASDPPEGTGHLQEAERAHLRKLEADRVELEATLWQTRRELTKAKEMAEEQAIRTERAEDEVIRLKAKLYDYMTASA